MRVGQNIRVVVTENANKDMANAQAWLRSLSPEAAERFSAVVKALVTSELPAFIAAQVEVGTRFVTDDAGSLHFSRPVYLHRLVTGKKRPARRSSSGLWRVYYDFADVDRSGQINTIRILALRHGAAAPLDAWLTSDDDE